MKEHGLYLPSGELYKGPNKPPAIAVPKAPTLGKKTTPQDTEMLVCFNDLQLYRQCDQEAFGAFMNFVEDNKKRITHVVANGDITDYYLQSKFLHDPKYSDDAQEEIDATKWVFKEVAKKVPQAEKVFIDGNHDYRWNNMINERPGMEAWVKTPDEMFDLKRLGWKHIEYGRGKFYQWHDMIFWHGHRAGAKSNVPKLELEDAGYVSGTSGHINRNMYHETRDVLGNRKFWVTLGGFSKDNLQFVSKANSGWTQGFGVYHYTPEIGIVPQIVPISHNNPQFIYDGRKYDGRGFEIPT